MLRAKRRPNLRVILSIALPSLALALTSFVPQNGQKICCQPLLESQRWMDWVCERGKKHPLLSIGLQALVRQSAHICYLFPDVAEAP